MSDLLQEIVPIRDTRGSLIALEGLSGLVPFEIARVYYLYDLKPDEPRGFHAHKVLSQALICVQGACRVEMDDGVEKREYSLHQPNQILSIPPHYWHVMSDFSSDAIVLVLASHAYDEDDYIRDYDEFLRFHVKSEG